jgi:P-type E1-E2 ATPase
MADAVEFELPGGAHVGLREVLLDFSGTLSFEGALIPGVDERLRALCEKLRVVVLTADTFGTARKALAGLPVEMHFIATGRDKRIFVEELGPEHVAAVGNGRNDADMVARARVGIAVVGPEGASGPLVAAADVVVRDINDALDLLLHPLRLTATMRA